MEPVLKYSGRDLFRGVFDDKSRSRAHNNRPDAEQSRPPLESSPLYRSIIPNTKKTVSKDTVFKILGEGLEPSRLTAPEPKSGVSANFTTRAKVMCDMCGLEWTMMLNSRVVKLASQLLCCRFASETWNTTRAKVMCDMCGLEWTMM